MNIAQNIERAQRLFPDKPALIFENKSLTYCELDEMSNQVANGLSDLGISRGDRVALFLPNIPSFVTTYFGIQKIGAVAVAMNSALKARETQFIIDDSGATVLVTTEALRRNVPAEELPALKLILIADSAGRPTAAKTDMALSEWMATASSTAQAVDMAPDDPATILYTSGTTGFPKGAVLSHGNTVSNVHTCTYTFRLHPDDRILLFVPAFHNFGLNAALNPCFDAGATLVLHREFEIEEILRSIVENGVTTFYGVPTIYTLLCEKASAERMRSVRRYVSAAATLPLEIAKKWREKFGVAISEGYGLTEGSLVCFNHFLKYKPGSVGSPLEGIEMRIADADGHELGPGELGEVIVRGPNVMLGYWNRPDETAEVIKNGWFYTGDIGRTDDDGYFYIVDRVKDMVNVSGQKAYPSEIENVFFQHSAVAEVAVYGVPDALLGEQVRASVILKPGEEVSAGEITTFCRQRMADFKVPSGIEFVTSLPKGRTGKILKKVLREQSQADSATIGNSERTGSPERQPVVPKSIHLSPEEVQNWMIEWLSGKLELDPETIETNRPLVDYGLTSVLAVNFAQDLGDWLEQPALPVIVWNFPTIELMIRYVVNLHVQKTDGVEQSPATPDTENSRIEFWPAIEGYFVYDPLMYELMANDEKRNQSYRVAIEKTVRDKVVVEVGTGQNAILARFCAEAGARQVYAIEVGKEAYQLAQTQVEKWGLSDKITLIHGDATRISLPEPADVCVSEIVGSIGGSQGAATIMNSARRFLKPDGLMIPQRSVTKMAAVTLPEEILLHPRFAPLARHYTQKIFNQVGHPFDVRLCLNNFSPSGIISASAIFEELDFSQPTPTEYQHEIALTINRQSRLDGFLLWLNLHTIAGEVIDILKNANSWLPIFIPVFDPGVAVSAGDTIQVVCTGTLCNNEMNPDYRIEGQLERNDGEILTFDYMSYHHEPYLKQTPFYERLFSEDEFSPDSEPSQIDLLPGTNAEISDVSTLSDSKLAELLTSEIAHAKKRKK